MCVFIQIEDMKHIKLDFCSDAWVIPQGWDFGAPGCLGVKCLFFKHGYVAYQIDENDELNRMQVKFSP